MFRRSGGVGLVVAVLAIASCTAPPEPVPEQPSVGVQLFQWPWSSVATECQEVLAPAGVEFVLLSPAQEHITGEQWWTSYQPVSYQLESKLGTRDEFARMVSDCSEAGVDVVADAVINHMAGVEGGTGFAGTSFTHYEYPGLYSPSDFHHCGLTPADDIADYQDRAQVTTCELNNLADLDTSSSQVQAEIAAYLDDLASLGVAGVRIDAAKHIPAQDLDSILGQTNADLTVISEVIRGAGEPIQPEEYLSIGSVLAFQFGREVSGLMPGGAYRRAVELKDGEIPSDQAYTFVANHDTERDSRANLAPGDDDFYLATVLMLAVPYGTPIVYSGYVFSERDQGAVTDEQGRVEPVQCPDPASESLADGQWTCGHREVLPLVRWRNVVGDAPVRNLQAETKLVSFDRGERGLVAINGRDTAESLALTTGLPDGRYCDAGQQEVCTEGDIEIRDGQVSVDVPARGVVVLHVNLRET